MRSHLCHSFLFSFCPVQVNIQPGRPPLLKLHVACSRCCLALSLGGCVLHPTSIKAGALRGINHPGGASDNMHVESAAFFFIHVKLCSPQISAYASTRTSICQITLGLEVEGVILCRSHWFRLPLPLAGSKPAVTFTLALQICSEQQNLSLLHTKRET